MYDYQNKNTDEVIHDFCEKAIEINNVLAGYYEYWKPQPLDETTEEFKNLSEEEQIKLREEPSLEREPDESIAEQFEDELGLKTKELNDIKSVFRYVYSQTGGQESQRTKDDVNKMIDSDDPIDWYAKSRRYRQYIKNYCMTRSLMFNQMSNRSYMDNKQALILGRW